MREQIREHRISTNRMRSCLQMYLVIGSINCKAEPLQVLKEALAGGTTLVQYREKGEEALVGEAKQALALQLQAACREAGVPFIVNDDVELALSIDADGVHIGQDDENAREVRGRIANRILGVSAHTVEEAKLATLHGADYLGVGPIYPTQSKADAHAVQGPAILRDMLDQGVQLPLVGIGGITAERAAEVIRAGADGVAVISAVTRAVDVRRAVVDILHSIEGCK
ncbi:Thiamine-phosphate synthase [compost metagenome]